MEFQQGHYDGRLAHRKLSIVLGNGELSGTGCGGPI